MKLDFEPVRIQDRRRMEGKSEANTSSRKNERERERDEEGFQFIEVFSDTS
jgi:hypothetical protein